MTGGVWGGSLGSFSASVVTPPGPACDAGVGNGSQQPSFTLIGWHACSNTCLPATGEKMGEAPSWVPQSSFEGGRAGQEQCWHLLGDPLPRGGVSSTISLLKWF